MTACRNKASRAVTAALVGVLSVGAVPMVAIAAPSEGAVVMSDTSNTIWNGTVTYKGEDSYVANGDPQGKEAVSLQPFGGADPVELEYHPAGAATKNGSYYYFYVEVDTSSSKTWTTDGQSVTYKNADGRDVLLKGDCVDRPTDAGTYAVVVGRKSETGLWEFVKSAETFTITARSLDGAQLVEAPALALDLGLEQGKNLCKTHGIHFLVVHSRHLPKSELIITQRLYHIYP